MSLGMLVAVAAITVGQSKPSSSDIDFRVRTLGVADKYDLKVVTPYFRGESPVYKAANTELTKLTSTSWDNFIGAVTEFERESPREWTPALWTLEVQPVVSYARPDLVSVVLNRYEYAGGAHPNRFSEVVNMGLVKGRPVKLGLDAIVLPGKAKSVIESHVLPTVNARKLKIGAEELDSIPAENWDNFIISPNGLTWIFDPYILGSYIEGEYIVKVKWELLKDVIDQSVLPRSVTGLPDRAIAR